MRRAVKKVVYQGVVVFMLGCQLTVGHAQVPPTLPLPPPVPKLPEKPPEIPPPPLAPIPSPPLEEKQPGEVPGVKVRIDRIQTRGNTVLTDAQLREVTKDYEGRELSTADIEALRLALTMYYINKGYVTSGAFVPDQDLKDNTLIVQIIEGRRDKIDIEGNNWFRRPYIRWRVERGAGPPLNVNTLQEKLANRTRWRAANAWWFCIKSVGISRYLPDIFCPYGTFRNVSRDAWYSFILRLPILGVFKRSKQAF